MSDEAAAVKFSDGARVRVRESAAREWVGRTGRVANRFLERNSNTWRYNVVFDPPVRTGGAPTPEGGMQENMGFPAEDLELLS